MKFDIDDERYIRLSKLTTAGLLIRNRHPKTSAEDRSVIVALLADEGIDANDPQFSKEYAKTSMQNWFLWIVAGAAYGVVLRIVFGMLPSNISNNGVMSAAFILGAPIVAGAFAVHAIPKQKRSLWRALIIPWAAVGLMLLGCLVTLLEGSICIALLSPIFLICGSVGGLAMYMIQGISARTGKHVSAFAFLPVILLACESFIPLTDQVLQIRRSVIINASPERVWREIIDARDIQQHELPFSLSHAIGVPRPVEGINRKTPDGEIRYSVWERGVRFQGVVDERREYQAIHWNYQFDSHSFPPGSMDEHVAIGGRFFDLSDTRFELEEVAPGQTELLIVAKYRVSSTINFYAIPAATFLGHDFVRTILGLYKYRSEIVEDQASSGAGDSSSQGMNDPKPPATASQHPPAAEQRTHF